MTDSATPLLELADVSKSFGKVVVADSLSLRVGGGDMIGIVGPNGAGKTTLFSLISGDLPPDSGEIRIGGAVVNRQGTAARCRLGIGRTYQVPRPFGAMTVFENVLVAVQQGGGLRRGASYERAGEVLERTGRGAVAGGPPGPWSGPGCRRRRLARRSVSGCSSASASSWPGRWPPRPGCCSW